MVKGYCGSLALAQFGPSWGLSMGVLRGRRSLHSLPSPLVPPFSRVQVLVQGALPVGHFCGGYCAARVVVGCDGRLTAAAISISNTTRMMTGT